MLTPDQIPDFVQATLSLFKKYKWTDISLEYPDYVASRINSEKAVKEQGGKDISFRLKTKNTGLARTSGLYAQDVTGVDDVLTSGSVGWKMHTVNWSYDIGEDEFQSDETEIIDMLKIREHDAMSDLAELREEFLWGSPTSTTDDRPMGIPFWIQKDASTTPEGAFNGVDPSGFTAGRANVSSVTYPRWRNWTFGYTNVTQDDWVRKVKFSLYKTNFRAPVPHPELRYSQSQRVIYTVYDVREPLERLAESRNDKLGNDVARYVNDVVVAGIPIESVHYLDANDSSDPSYGVDWGVFRPFIKRGWDNRRTMKSAAKQRNVREVHYDTYMNYCCYNLRALWVGSKA